jgi:hypothetical protein
VPRSPAKGEEKYDVEQIAREVKTDDWALFLRGGVRPLVGQVIAYGLP